MAVHRRRRGGTPRTPPPLPDQRDHRGKQRNLQSGKSDQAIFGTQTFRSQTPPPRSPQTAAVRPSMPPDRLATASTANATASTANATASTANATASTANATASTANATALQPQETPLQPLSKTPLQPPSSSSAAPPLPPQTPKWPNTGAKEGEGGGWGLSPSGRWSTCLGALPSGSRLHLEVVGAQLSVVDFVGRLSIVTLLPGFAFVLKVWLMPGRLLCGMGGRRPCPLSWGGLGLF